MANITNIQRLAERLGLFNLARQYFRVQEEGIPNLEFLEYVLSKELEMRDDKRVRTMKDKARLPEEKRLDDFNLDYQTGVTKFMLDKLSEAEWIEDKYNLLIMGSSGVGKTHLATGLALKVIEKGNKVFYTTLDNLFYLIRTKDTIAKSKSRLNYINECRLIILDEIGYLPLGAEDAKTVYSFIDNINKRISLIIITNREFEKWKDLFHDEVIAMTLLDRITEKCQVIKLTGESYRFLNHKNIYSKKQK